MLRLKKMKAIILLFSIILASSTGYAYGTTRDDGKLPKTRSASQHTHKEKTNKINVPKNYKDGTYTGSANGYGGLITVQVVVKDGKIIDLKVLSHTETPGYYENGAQVINRVLQTGTLDVDTIAGATLTSHGILEAASIALGQQPKALTSPIAKPKAPSSILQITDGESLIGKTLKDGIYQGSASGYAGPLTVELSIQNGKLKSLNFISGNDDEPYLSSAKTLLPKIIQNQGTQGIDVVSGATYSSRGLLNATNAALKKAYAVNGNHMNSENVSTDTQAANQKTIEKLKKELEKLRNETNLSIDEGKGVLKDGSYIGKAMGFKGEVEVKLVVSGGKITSAELLKHTDDVPYMDRAKTILSHIVEKQGTSGVDAVTNATYSSNGIINATKRALQKARGITDTSINDETNNAEATIKRLNEEIAKLKKELEGDNKDDVNGSMKDGSYTGKARGYGGSISVTITVENGKITSAQLGNHHDDSPYIDNAQSILDTIVANNGTKGVDVVSGATYSSRGILNAVRKAMEKATEGNESTEEDTEENPGDGKIKQLENEIESLKSQLEDLRSKSGKSAENLKDGEYTGNASGRNGNIKAIISIENHKIKSIKLDHQEDREVGNKKYFTEEIESNLIAKIIEKNGTKDVDTISGATISTSGVLNAVNNALEGKSDHNDKPNDNKTDLIEKIKLELKDFFTYLKEALFEQIYSSNSDQIDEAKIMLKDGDYHGTGLGWFNGNDSDREKYKSRTGAPYNRIGVTISIKDGVISNVSFDPNSDTPDVFNDAAETIKEQLISKKSTNGIDTVSGATYSSRGILQAVNIALFKSMTAKQYSDSANNSDTENEILKLKEENKKLQEENEALKKKLADSDIPSDNPSSSAETDSTHSENTAE